VMVSSGGVKSEGVKSEGVRSEVVMEWWSGVIEDR
jgi:hypothetical protein